VTDSLSSNLITYYFLFLVCKFLIRTLLNPVFINDRNSYKIPKQNVRDRVEQRKTINDENCTLPLVTDYISYKQQQPLNTKLVSPLNYLLIFIYILFKKYLPGMLLLRNGTCDGRTSHSNCDGQSRFSRFEMSPASEITSLKITALHIF